MARGASLYHTCKCSTVHCTLHRVGVKAARVACVCRLANSAAAHASFSLWLFFFVWGGGGAFSFSRISVTVRHSDSLSCCLLGYETVRFAGANVSKRCAAFSFRFMYRRCSSGSHLPDCTVFLTHTCQGVSEHYLQHLGIPSIAEQISCIHFRVAQLVEVLRY